MHKSKDFAIVHGWKRTVVGFLKVYILVRICYYNTLIQQTNFLVYFFLILFQSEFSMSLLTLSMSFGNFWVIKEWNHLINQGTHFYISVPSISGNPPCAIFGTLHVFPYDTDLLPIVYFDTAW